MAKKKTGKHLQFYMDCMKNKGMPRAGLCACAESGIISVFILHRFIPNHEEITLLYEGQYLIACNKDGYWGAGTKANNSYNIHEREHGFTSLRQTIVLFMAAINGEL